MLKWVKSRSSSTSSLPEVPVALESNNKSSSNVNVNVNTVNNDLTTRPDRSSSPSLGPWLGPVPARRPLSRRDQVEVDPGERLHRAVWDGDVSKVDKLVRDKGRIRKATKTLLGFVMQSCDIRRMTVWLVTWSNGLGTLRTKSGGGMSCNLFLHTTCHWCHILALAFWLGFVYRLPDFVFPSCVWYHMVESCCHGSLINFSAIISRSRRVMSCGILVWTLIELLHDVSSQTKQCLVSCDLCLVSCLV